MPDTFTGNYGLTQPEVGASLDTWGTKLNANMGVLDELLGMFVGMVVYKPATGAQDGWLEVDGSDVSRETYDRLWQFAQDSNQLAATEEDKLPGQFGPGDGTDTFSLPDLRGYVIRTYDDGAGVDDGREAGSVQDDQNKEHSHTGTASSGGNHNHGGSTGNGGGHSHSGSIGSNGSHSHSGSTNSGGSHSHNYLMATDMSPDGGSYMSMYGKDDSGSTQTSGILSSGGHSHSLSINSNGSHSHSLSINSVSSHSHSIGNSGTHTHDVTISTSGGGDEVRVKNVALTAYIKT